MIDAKAKRSHHLIAFGTMVLIGVPVMTLGALMTIKLLALITGVDWTQRALPDGPWGWVYAAVVLLGVILATYAAIYAWLRLLRGRVPNEVIYFWLTAGPQPPILSDLARRMYRAMYEHDGSGAA